MCAALGVSLSLGLAGQVTQRGGVTGLVTDPSGAVLPDVAITAVDPRTGSPALGPPDMVFGSPGFGAITTAGDPRVMQVAVKVVF
jgi:hypothetical protein